MSDMEGQEPRSDTSEVDGYLARVSARLRMPDDSSAAVLEELADHIADAVAAGIRAGLTPDEAERHALDRLGSPDDLGEELRRAHQTRKRLLAAAGGGIWPAAKGAVRGYFAGIVISIALLFGVAALLTLVSKVVPLSIPASRWFEAIAYPSIWAGAWLAAREFVKSVSTRSRRRISTLRGPIAWIGAGLVSVLVVLVPANHTQLTVTLAIATPFLFAAGALTADRDVIADVVPDRWALEPRVLRRRLFVGFIALVVAAISAPIVVGPIGQVTVQGPESDPDAPAQNRWIAAGYGVVAPRVIDYDELWIRTGFPRDGFLVVRVPDDRVDWDEWPGLQFEVWPATDPFADGGAQRIVGNTAIAIVPIQDPWAPGDRAIRVGYPDADGFLLFLVAQDPVTGDRVGFGHPEGDVSRFHGSLIDWFNFR